MNFNKSLLIGLSAIALIGCGGGGGDTGFSQDPSKLRVAVANYQEPSSLDAYWGDQRFVENVPGGYLSGYASVAPGTGSVEFRDEPGRGLVAKSEPATTLVSGNYFTSVTWNSEDGPRAMIVQDEHMSLAGKGKARFLHTAANLGQVDVYIVPAATDIRTLEPSFKNVQPGAATPYVEFTPQYVDVVVTRPGQKTQLFAYGVELASQGVRSVIMTRNQASNLWAMVLKDSEF